MHAKIINGQLIQFPYNFMDLRGDYPNVSFPIDLPDAQLATFNMVRVIEQERPVVDRFHIVTQKDMPDLVDGQWVLQWVVTAKTEEELAIDTEDMANRVRGERDGKLRDSDWTQLVDSPTDKPLWLAYRQALREMPLQPGFPWEVTWPPRPHP